MLLARLQREAHRRTPGGVDRHADQPAGHAALVLVARGEEPGVRAAVAHRHAEPLGGPDHDVGAPLPRRDEDHQREEIGGHRDERALIVQVAHQRRGRRGSRPVVPGYCNSTPNTPSAGMSGSIAPTTTSMPIGSARVRTTAIVCGWHSASTKNVLPPFSLSRCSIAIASAAAVGSSSSDAFAMSIAVRSLTIVWKLRSASRRPCEISGWYGVYAVYQAGFSSTLRWITGGVNVLE